MTFDTEAFFKRAVVSGASDIHLHVGEYPTIRKNGKIIKVDLPKLTEEDLAEIVKNIIPKNIKTMSISAYDLDFSYAIPGVSRFRVNLSHLVGKPALVIRCVPYEIKSPEELNLPPSIEQFTKLNNGLVLVTGPTGCGKSTTLASLIDFMNKKQPKHIITIEDPIEFVFNSKKAIISQRQVGIDTPSLSEGIKYALRQDPDIILIGEIRDEDTLSNALKAAETGHLVFATLHTNDAIQTINRMINLVPDAQRTFVRNQIANVLRGTISQKLVLSKDKVTRYPACEILVKTAAIKDFIEKEEFDEIYHLINKGSFENMITMNKSLYNLTKEDKISDEEALANSDNKVELQQMIKGLYHGTGI